VRLRVDATAYWRDARNAADDDQLLNTGVSYPIAFDRGETYGAEAKVQLVGAGPVGGFASYSYMVAKLWFPVTGGLFLGKDAEQASQDLNGHFPATQDQRNTLATRWEWKLMRRLQVAAGATYGSGLPFEYDGTEEEALAQYGPDVVSRLNFERGRTLPLLAVSASAIAELYSHEHVQVNLHVDGDNLNGRLNVIDFGGLFSGNAIGPGRSVMMRLDTRF
jgi:TonB dependent receptor